MKFKFPLFDREILRLMSITVFTKSISIFTQVLIATFFGAGAQLDAYAFSLFPIQSLGQTLSGIFSSVGIPQVMRMRKTQSPLDVHQFQNAMILIFSIPALLYMLGMLSFGNQFIDLFGYQLPEETKNYAYKMIKILSIPGFILFLVGVFSSLLNLNRHFQIPAAMLPLNAAVILISLVSLHGKLGIWSLPIGFSISLLVQVPIVIVSAVRNGSFRPIRPSISRTGIGDLWSLSWMVLTSQVLLIVNSFVDKWFASGLEVGSISAINYSLTLLNFGQQIFSMSLIIVMFTKMSELLSKGEVTRCSNYIETNLKKAAHLVVPVSLALVVISPELVRVLFQHGAFGPEDSIRTSGALSMYLLGLPAVVINGIVTKIFQSQQKLREKTFLSLQYILTNIVGNMILVKSLATTGLAISSSVAINLHLLLSLIVLYHYRTGLNIKRFISIILTAYAIALITWLTYSQVGMSHAIERVFQGRGRIEIMFLGAAKFASIVLIYGVQLLVWWVFSKRSHISRVP